ncbi:MAG: hypothetical protein KatS3mg003_1375 [Candidatus Nitrosocaldaceae archaeon]|nr:MAG: hypothetical protein KatS3mg003_1375 [Candidatus Nitrosocaldaceae archaeon]
MSGIKGILYGAGASTVIAGILHLILVPNVINFNVNTAIFFLVSGILQIFWFWPTVKMHHKAWYYVGIAGTIILIGLWAGTRVENPITQRALPINPLGIAVEVFQVAYIALASIILAKWSEVKAKAKMH